MIVSDMLKDLLLDDKYNKARVVVIDDKNHFIVNEALQHILFRTMKMLASYEEIDFDLVFDEQATIVAIIIISRRVSA